MSSYLLFLILGLGSGATYAILGQGLVLKYRSAGVVDFAHGAVAMFIAYVFVNLRSFGELELPLVLLPHQISLNGGAGLSTGLAIVISLVYAAVLGLLLYVIVYRPLQSASPLTRVCASVGVMLTLQAIAVLNYSTEPVATNPIFPSSGLTVAGITFPEDRLFSTGVVVVISVALAPVYPPPPHRRPELGHRDRAGGGGGHPDRPRRQPRPDLLHAVRGARPGRRADRPDSVVLDHRAGRAVDRLRPVRDREAHRGLLLAAAAGAARCAPVRR